MLRNYLRIALRNLVNQKLYSFINIVGLAIGIACCVLLFLFVRNELNYDTFHENYENLYRIYITEDLPQRDPFSYVEAPAQLAGAFEESFPEVEHAVRLGVRTDVIKKFEDATFKERYHLADPDFFEVFSFPLLKGNPSRVLQNLNSVVFTERMANKIFGHGDVLGQSVSIKLGDEFHDFLITGIAENVPENSSIKFDIILPFENVRKYVSDRVLDAWFNVFLETYVQLSKDHNPADFESKLATVVQNHYPPRSHDMVTLHLQPITDIHLNPEVPAGFEPTSDPKYSYILMGIALLVLTIACINFMTLAIGRSSSRAREVGVRKVLGAFKAQLIKQFWGEAILMSMIALMIGILLVELFLPFFNEIANKQLSTTYDFTTLFVLAFLMLVVALLAGSYPAFLLARFQPAVVIKGETAIGGVKFFGKSLVVLQFALSIFLIISTLIMTDQLHYLRTKNLGFNKEQVVVIRNYSSPQRSNQVVERFRNALANRNEIKGVSGASSGFATPWTTMGFNAEDGTFKQFYQQTVDYDYLKTLEIELVEGRDFSKQFGTDSSEAIIVNQAFVVYFGWDSASGRSLPGRAFPPHRIIGVVENFNFDALHHEVAPLALVLDPTTLLQGINDISTSLSPRALNYVHVRISPKNISETIDLLKKTWGRIAPQQPFSFSFLDEDVDQQYKQEERWGKMVGYASMFAISIACLGLFGLAALTVVRRTKEIGIRKVLGASVPNIMLMLSKDFGKLVILANLIAWPAAFFIMNQWLQNFAYRVSIAFDNFLLSAVLAVLFALFAVSYQSIKAALTDPVNSLRYE
ncbi:FtsX-like permease family protein [candidate division KSB1 bacterium]|nr:FtsX-like permease family protein [candidate division KSB1 bacterium]NIR73344.1 FtsX-like permease family protein [candidate division KSB1 bacterium]NIS27050.1 FtsX-like permease family protein [candidate division KSB1 bacterium]NIT73890.1 FtsX-like permease family protein [candidate division KSB1 bacterium]NIU27795.1 FtsX-like permease family protein [candidate division KSB1 bacterium]